MTRAEESLFLYLETRAVDYGGVVDSARMNEQEMAQCRAWNGTGFIRFGRISMKTLPERRRDNPEPFYWVELTEDSWAAAHELRERSAARGLASRTWEKAGHA